jgi:RNA polymerase sigma-70 factor (ECF subfamily)
VELVEGRSARAVGRAPEADADFVEWIAPHWEVMRRIAWRLGRPGDGDDVLQNALIAAWRHRDRFDQARGSARAWLARITVNEARKSLRSWRRTEPEVDIASTDDAAAATATHDALAAAIAALPKRQAMAVHLTYYVGLSVREAADVMGCAEGTVKSTLSAARAALRARLEDGS